MPGPPPAGSTVLHYRLLRSIGSGGMGVVYEAEDTLLGRKVALKFLPPALARDRASLERFQREARAASALNHPNICTIHAIERWQDEHFIVMELLDGESLDRRISGRALPWEHIADIGAQVADALDAAHQRGVVHRDIKPANIFLTRDQRAKVLDFGVAKMPAGSAGDAETVGVSRVDQQLTGPGMAVGTIAYMSPEQARAEDIDGRSDLFSLAAVLYEMATGRPAFPGNTSAVIFQQILGGTPDPPGTLAPSLPARLDEIIVKGLEKDRDLRYQTAAELRGDLRRLKRDAQAGRVLTAASTSAAVAGATGTRPSSGAILAAEARRRKGLFGVVGLLLAGLVAAAGYGVYSLTRGAAAVSDEANATLEVTRVTNTGDASGCGSISPDGRYVVYCDFADRLKIVQTATGSVLPLEGPTGATTFSPDGDFVYVSATSDEHPQGVLLRLPVLPGEPRRIQTDLFGAVGVSPDGRQIAFLRHFPEEGVAAVMIADATGANARRVAAATRGRTFLGGGGVSWSPRGTHLAVTLASNDGGLHMTPAVVDIATGAMTPFAHRWPNVGRAVWLPDHRILFSARERITGPYQFWIGDVAAGTVRRITSDARGFGNMSVGATADGRTIVTVPWDIASHLWVTDAEARRPPEQWTSGTRRDGINGLTADASGRIFFDASDGVETAIWSVDAAGGRARKLTPEDAGQPTIPRDGSFVVFVGLHQGRVRIQRMHPDGSDITVLSDGMDEYGPLVSPDARWVYYGTANGFVRVAATGGVPTSIGPPSDTLIDISPDSRLLLVLREAPVDGSATGLVLLDAETLTMRGAVRVPVDAIAGWGRNNDVIAYAHDRDGVTNIWEQPIAGGPPRQLTHFSTGRIFAFNYSPDGTRLLLAKGTRTGDVTLVRGFK